MDGAGLFFLLLLLLIIIPAGAWIFYTRYRAHKQGLPAPPLSAYNPFNRRSRGANPFADTHSSSGAGPLNWVKDKFSGITGGGSSGRSKGAYHGTSAAHSRLDPDGAWDVNLGDEADRFGGAGYEEQELGYHPDNYGGGGYGQNSNRGQALPGYGSEERGRARSRHDENSEGGGFIGGNQRGLDQRYDEEVHGATSSTRNQNQNQNPFGEGAERSDLRGVSPRPMDDHLGHKKTKSKDSTAAGERRSAFRETL